MFILYPVFIGLVLGLVLGGRPAGLSAIQFRWGWAILAGLAIQIVLFSEAVTGWIGGFGVPFYVLSTGLVLAAVLANRRIRGMLVVALGAVSNMAAIVANGGYMPASVEAMAVLGRTPQSEYYSNSSFVAQPALAPLTDIFVLPPWLPWTNIFSIGDVLIGIGVIVIIVTAMRRPSATLVGAS